MRIEPNQTYAAAPIGEQQTAQEAQQTVSATQIQEFLQQLQETYSHVSFEITALTGVSAITEYALLSGNGMHLVISPDFISFMQESEDNMQKGMSTLHKVLQQLTKKGLANLFSGGTGAVIDEEGKASFWSAHTANKEMESSLLAKQLELMQIQQQRAKKAQQNMPKKKVSYSASSISSRIASASTVYSVHSAMGQAYGSLIQLEHCKGDNRYDRAAVCRAIAHAKNAISAAKMKIRNLEKEELTRKQIQKAAQKKQRRKEEQLKYTLEKTRKGNRSAEFGLLRKSNLEYYSPLNSEQEKDYFPELPGSGGTDFAGGIDVTAMAGYGSMMAAADIVSSSSGVTITAPVEIS